MDTNRQYGRSPGTPEHPSVPLLGVYFPFPFNSYRQKQPNRFGGKASLWLRMQLKNSAIHIWLLSLVLVPPGLAQINHLKIETTATQAVFFYQTTSPSPCTIQISEAGDAQVIHDVDTTLFPGSNLDSRQSGVTDGSRRVFVAGLRTAEKATNGRRYSRALQSDTLHNFLITCGSDTSSGSFRTGTIPLGLNYVEALPADPASPGEYAWPDVEWQNRNQKIVDPRTGALIRRMSLPSDSFEYQGYGDVTHVIGLGAAWTNPNAVLADDAQSATLTGGDPAFLFLGAETYRGYYGGTHAFMQYTLNQMRLLLNAWCSGAGCDTASPSDRTIEVCLTANGMTCDSPILEKELAACTSNCTDQAHRFEIGDTQPVLNAWFANVIPTLGVVESQLREGYVARNGTAVTFLSGNQFNVNWKAGSRITINSVPYLIASVQNETSLTLQSAPATAESDVLYRSANFGFLIRKKTATSHELSIQYARWWLERGGYPAEWNAGGNAEIYGNCSYTLVQGPGGEMGWRCSVGGSLYWVGQDSGTVVNEGLTLLNARGAPDGWSYGLNAFIDKTNPNIFYTLAPDSEGNTNVVRATYQGDVVPEVGISIYAGLRECKPSIQVNCWVLENLTPSSQGLSLTQQAANFHPDWGSFHAGRIEFLSLMGTSNRMQFLLRRDGASNDLTAFLVIFDPTQGRVIAAHPSWRYWPTRWAPLHGADDIGDTKWVSIPTTWFRGPYSGKDYFAGNGPYYSRITSGAFTNQGQACPARPSDSPVPAEQWPTGNRCLTVTVDGEPGDPTPFYHDSGTVSTSGATVTGQGTSWTPSLNGRQMKLGSNYYQFTYLSSTQGTLNPVPPAVSNSTYRIYLEPVNHPKLPNPDFGYLQDAEVRDVFCATADPGNYTYHNGCGFYFQVEFFRLIIKNGNTYVLERGYPNTPGSPQPYYAQGPNAYLIAMPSSCSSTFEYFCQNGVALWNSQDDPYGTNTTGTTVLTNQKEEGGGHSYLRPGSSGNAVGQTCGEAIDGDYYRCYNGRVGTMPGILNAQNMRISLNPPFNGKTGVGSPNAVESHPSHPQAIPRLGLPDYMLDGRPFNGSPDFTGSAQQPGVNIAGDLFKFVPAQTPRLRPKFLPTLASCGVHPLVDISGPSSQISENAANAYQYCIANAAGECRGGSQPGELFVNCPKTSRPYCGYPGVAVGPAELRDICVGDQGAHTSAITQTLVWKPDLSGKMSRVITHGLSLYKWIDVFWNAKGTPDGKWIFLRTNYVGGIRTELLLVKNPSLPPMDSINRGDFIRIREKVGKPGPGVHNVVVEFGYDPQFHCASRNESCLNGADSEHKYASEALTGVPCQNGCEVVIPAIPQRVVYSRLRYRNSANQTIAYGPLQVRVTP